jgi:hypothetical protein
MCFAPSSRNLRILNQAQCPLNAKKAPEATDVRSIYFYFTQDRSREIPPLTSTGETIMSGPIVSQQLGKRFCLGAGQGICPGIETFEVQSLGIL